MAYQLIKDESHNTDYVGKAEVCTYEFSTLPEQIPGEPWLANLIIDRHIAELSSQNSKLLRIKVWRDTAPTWQTDYKVEVAASASPLFWNVIIIGVLAIVALVITWKIISIVKDVDWGKAALPVTAGAIGIIIVIVALLLALRYKK